MRRPLIRSVVEKLSVFYA